MAGAQPLAKQGSSPERTATLRVHRQGNAALTGTTCSILHTNWDQFEIQPRRFSMTRVMWKAAALIAAFSNDSGNFLPESLEKPEAQRNAWLKDEQVSIHSGLCTKISAGHQGYKNPGCHLSSLRGSSFFSEKINLYSKVTLKHPCLLMKVTFFCSEWPNKAYSASVLVQLGHWTMNDATPSDKDQ